MILLAALAVVLLMVGLGTFAFWLAGGFNPIGYFGYRPWDPVVIAIKQDERARADAEFRASNGERLPRRERDELDLPDWTA